MCLLDTRFGADLNFSQSDTLMLSYKSAQFIYFIKPNSGQILNCRLI